MNTIPTFLVIISLIGNVLVIRQDWRGQLLWIISNIGWIYIDVKAGLYEQAFLFAVYLLLSVWGMIAWKRRQSCKKS